MSPGGFHNYGGGANLELMPALSATRPGFGAWSLRSLGVQGLVFAEALGKQGDGVGRGGGLHGPGRDEPSMPQLTSFSVKGFAYC